MKIIIGADDAGVRYRDRLAEDLRADDRVDEVVVLGPQDGRAEDYPGVAAQAATMISDGEADRAILVCGTGLGMAIAANKIKGIRAATAHDSFSVERSVLSNDAQVLAMGERVIGLELARRLAKEWLGYTFDPTSRSAPKVEAIKKLED
ncbi:ribose-5-phosphate isomerase [Naumannella cuiyingiana]|uniref:D-erythrulose 4-phosphate isomerase n=1 Tax=Naumannella cuiyingiana TaxID=1347891 RepID=A0A7Z0D966_9ACTN|nr:ribose 5-phosphate isomerase B [Naumannella cuiyingiana]